MLIRLRSRRVMLDDWDDPCHPLGRATPRSPSSTRRIHFALSHTPEGHQTSRVEEQREFGARQPPRTALGRRASSSPALIPASATDWPTAISEPSSLKSASV